MQGHSCPSVAASPPADGSGRGCPRSGDTRCAHRVNVPAREERVKRRADLVVVEQGLAESRTRAQALIMAGRVRPGDRPLAKPGDLLEEKTPLSVDQPE